MTLTYSLSEEDYLQSQLFLASKTKSVKKRRQKEWLIFSSAFSLLGIIYALTLPRPEAYYFIAYYLLGAVVFTFVAYPPYQRGYYLNHYRKYVNKTFKNKFDQETTTTFNNDIIEGADATGNSQLNLNQIGVIHETGLHIYLMLKTGSYIIIPKEKLKNVEELRELLITISKKLSIDFISELNWKWK